MKKILAFLLSIVLLFGFSNSAFALSFTYENDVQSLLVGNVEDGKILYSKNSETAFPVASMSKLMTYLVAKDAIEEGKVSLSDTVTITEESSAFNRAGYSRFGLTTGTKVSLEDLFVGLLVVSGNDAAQAIAVHVGGDAKTFVEMMNDKAQELGLSESSFVNPSGLTQEDVVEIIDETNDPEFQEEAQQDVARNIIYNKMSSRDLFKLASHIVRKYPETEEYGKMENVSYPERNYEQVSTLPLQDYDSMVGLKTGFTEEAGYGFTGLFDMSIIDPSQNYKFITIVMGAEDTSVRKDATIELYNYVVNNYSYRAQMNENLPFVDFESDDTKERFIPLYPSGVYSNLYPNESRINISYELYEDKEAPFEAGEVLGKASLEFNGENVGEVDLVTREFYPKLTFFERFVTSFEHFFNNLMSML